MLALVLPIAINHPHNPHDQNGLDVNKIRQKTCPECNLSMTCNLYIRKVPPYSPAKSRRFDFYQEITKSGYELVNEKELQN